MANETQDPQEPEVQELEVVTPEPENTPEVQDPQEPEVQELEVVTPEPENTPEVQDPQEPETPAVDPNQAQADVIFSTFPHVHTIWFDDKGEWRFYETPGTTPIERTKKEIKIDISNL